ncbi:chymotrypsin-1-like [Zophobas morio]|uniref:chymotrypsin-1-like n=1 Tax=Zophobas morio TaxID=2755281 RepID=UPI003083E39A
MHYTPILVLIIASTIQGVPSNKRDFYDTIASPGQFPFVVSIDDPVDASSDIPQPAHDCPGVIINNNWVLTAARCFSYLKFNRTVNVGTNVLHSGGTRYNMIDYFQHDNYTITSTKNNIAQIRIDGQFEFNELVQPIEYGDFEENSACVEIGWEYLGSFEFLEDLRFINLTAIGYEKCKDIAGEVLGDEDLGPEQMCSLRPEGGESCRGNAGGPLVCDGKLVGIGSFALPPCEEGSANVYERPMAYIDWIERIIREN